MGMTVTWHVPSDVKTHVMSHNNPDCKGYRNGTPHTMRWHHTIIRGLPRIRGFVVNVAWEGHSHGILRAFAYDVPWKT